MLTELSLDPLLDQELEGHHRAERVLNTEVPYVWYFDRLDREDVRLHQLVTKRFHFWSTKVRGHTLSSRCYASPR